MLIAIFDKRLRVNVICRSSFNHIIRLFRQRLYIEICREYEQRLFDGFPKAAAIFSIFNRNICIIAYIRF